MGFNGLHVLIAEDEMILAEDLVDELSALGAVPIGPAPSIEGAMECIKQSGPIDAALINVQLRGKLSSPVADALINRNIPFVFVTGDDEFVRENYPLVPCCPKPSDIPKVLQVLQGLIDPAA